MRISNPPPDAWEECHGCGYRRLVCCPKMTEHFTRVDRALVWMCHYCVVNASTRPIDENGKCLGYTTDTNVLKEWRNESGAGWRNLMNYIENGKPQKHGKIPPPKEKE